MPDVARGAAPPGAKAMRALRASRRQHRRKIKDYRAEQISGCPERGGPCPRAPVRARSAPMSTTEQISAADLQSMAQKLRRISVLSTSEAGSGHPSTCMSAAELVSVLFFDEMRFDPSDPSRPGA